MKSINEHYDAMIIGGGKAGKTLAMDLTRGGKKVALIEGRNACGSTSRYERQVTVYRLARYYVFSSYTL